MVWLSQILTKCCKYLNKTLKPFIKAPALDGILAMKYVVSEHFTGAFSISINNVQLVRSSNQNTSSLCW